MNPVFNMVPIAPSTIIPPPSQTLEPIHRAKRTRAKRSCDSCRKKKTRCDADVKQPCTKCALADIPCEFLVEQKKRGPSSGSYIEELEDRLIRMENLLHNISKEKSNEMDHDTVEKSVVHDRQSSSSSLSPHTPTRTSYYEEEDDEDIQITDPDPKFTCMDFLRKDLDMEIVQEQMDNLTISDYERTRYFGASAGVQFLKDEFLQVNIKHPLPEDPSWFVQKLNDDEDEHVIMKSKQLVSLPVIPDDLRADRIEIFENTPYLTQELADYLIHIYFTRLHMYCPVINKIQFLEQYYFHNPTPPDKYILFAMTSISLAVFSSEILTIDSLNFTTEQLNECHDVLKSKAHKLLGIVHKRSRICTVQALILLSMFTSHEIDDEDTSHWFMTGMAIRMAQDLGLHRDCTKWKIPDYEVELRKRIWYAAYLMDRWVASELGRPITIFDHEFDVELPTPYEVCTPFTKLRENAPILMIEAEASLKRKQPVYSCFLYLVTLAQITGQVLVGFHSTRGKRNPYDNLELLQVLDKNLTIWKATLPTELTLNSTETSDEYFYAPACVVNMACDCTRILLYRPFIKLHKNEPENTELAFKALSVCTDSAKNLVSIVESAQHQSFLALPWNMAVYAVFQAGIIFLHNAKGGNAAIREQGVYYSLRCSRIYNHDPYLRKTRIIKVLQQIIYNFTGLVDDENYLMEHISSVRSKNGVCPLIKQRTKKVDTPSNKSIKEIPVNHSRIDKNTVSELSQLSSTRAEDMFLSSLTYGLQQHQLQQQRILQQNQLQNQLQQQYIEHQQYVERQRQIEQKLQLQHHLEQQQQAQQQAQQAQQQQRTQQQVQQQAQQQHTFNIENQAEEHFNPYSRIELIDEYEPLQQEFDIASLSSKLPIWEVPSGVTWNEWETFLKSNIPNDNEIYQSTNL